jgi:lipoprotein-releasing system permease protein
LNFPLYIAKRYFIAKKSHNVINIISWVSVSGIAVGTLALVIVLSAFNGLEDLVEKLYASFDPDIKIETTKGKTFEVTDFPKDKILQLEEVMFYNHAVEDVVLVKYMEKQTIATLKGVEPQFYEMTGLDTLLIEGKVFQDDSNKMVLGYGIADKLSLYLHNMIVEQVSIIVPKKGLKKTFVPTDEFTRKFAIPTGVFSVNPDFDTKYVVTPLRFAQKVLSHEGKVTSVELGLNKKADAEKVKEKIQSILGNDFSVKTRHELNELIFKTNKTEKWITFLILTFILVIASFNIIGSLTMLIIDKKKDIWILRTMGASRKTIRQLFFMEGMIINLVGAFSGMLLGAFVCWLQIQFGILRLEGSVVEFYPIKLEVMDFLYITIIVLIIGFLASWYPVRVLTKRHL